MSPFDALVELIKRRHRLHYMPAVGTSIDLANGTFKLTLVRTRHQLMVSVDDMVNGILTNIYQSLPDDDTEVNALVAKLVAAYS